MYPHRIRLRGPWECEPLARLGKDANGRAEASPGPVPPGCRMTLPCRWNEGGLGDFAGRVRFIRHFGLPRQLDPHERVWLTFAGVDDLAQVWLNGQFLGRHQGAHGPFEFDVTPLLRERNLLTVEVESLGNGGLWGEVALEVRALAFLRDVRLAATFEGTSARLRLTGEVVGALAHPLELYALLDGSTVAYAKVRAAEAGREFEVVSDVISPERWRPLPGDPTRCNEVRVELVNAATVWYTLAQPFTFRRQAECPGPSP